tara:strand:- start:508 stop:1179 length:672 start_codon:yes stop_codon:yes gene_type:complete
MKNEWIFNVIIIVFIIFFVGLLILVFWRMGKKRTEQFALISAELKLNFFPKGSTSLFERLKPFHLFSKGWSRKIKNLMEGEAHKVELAIFDYQYTTHGGQHPQTHRQSLLFIRSPKLNLPDFSLRPENVFHKIGSAFGDKDIDFETHPIFSKSYLLRGDNEVTIRGLFNNELLNFIQSQQKISIEGSGDQLIFYRHKNRLKPEEVESFMEEGFQVLDQFLRST